MKVQIDPKLFKKLKKLHVAIRKNFKEKIILFAKNPYDPVLNNHPLKRGYEGYRSIDITQDYRAIYEEIALEDQTIAYFVLIGTHKQLYQQRKTN